MINPVTISWDKSREKTGPDSNQVGASGPFWTYRARRGFFESNVGKVNFYDLELGPFSKKGCPPLI